MDERDDWQLLQAYVRDGSDAAFEALVERHVNLVYSTALRQVGDSGMAGEVTQTVFIILAQKAKGLVAGVVLTGWLYRTTQFTVLRARRAEQRRQFREQEAARMKMESTGPADSVWDQMAPLLEEGMARLGETDRNALLLRFFENKSLRELGTALGSSEDAAQKRVLRALEKLRRFFARRGVVLTVVVIPAVLSANAVKAAPAGVASSAALKGASASASTAALLHATLRGLTWMQVKTGLMLGASMLVTATLTSLSVRAVVEHAELRYQGHPWSYWLTGYDNQQNGPEWNMADAAVRAVGTNAIPVLLKMFTETDADLGQADDRVVANARVVEVSGGSGSGAVPAGGALRHHLQASFAFQALGPVASNAVPDLMGIFQKNYLASPPLRDGILEAIGGIGPAASNAIPVLIQSLPALADGDRANVLRELGKIHAEPQSVLPVLTASLQDPSMTVRGYALVALAHYGVEARPAVPAIQALTMDPSAGRQIKDLASKLLQQIGADDAREQNRGNTQ